jgi:hypothetical protein
MRKSVALLLVLVFLTASCIVVAKPALSSADVVEDSWVSKAPLPQGKSGGLVVVNGKIYAIGGTIENYMSGFGVQSGSSKTVNTNYEYDPALDRWTIKPPMPTPRYGFATAVYENSIYCIGGILNIVRFGLGVEVVTPAVEALNLSTNKWETKTPMPTRIGNFATIVHEDNIYCIGEGINEVYNIATDTWQTKTPMPFNGTIMTANVVNGKLYLTSYSQMYFYNPVMDSWTTSKAPILTEYRTVSAVIDNKIYFPSANLTQIYDTESDMVSVGAPPPSDFIGGIALATTGEMAPKRIYILHGALLVYDSEADNWVIGAKMPTDRSNLGFAVVNDKIYAIGGNAATSSPCTKLPIPYADLYPTISVTQLATNEEYTPFGYGTVPPVISVASPENRNYNSSEIQLNFTVNRQADWMGYSLDGNENVTLTGNTTINGLSSGLHNVTIYAKDELGNIGTSETICFSIELPFPTTLVAAAFIGIVAVIGVGLLVYFKKHNKIWR